MATEKEMIQTLNQRCESLINSINCLKGLLKSDGLQLSKGERELIKEYILEHATHLSRNNLPYLFSNENEEQQ